MNRPQRFIGNLILLALWPGLSLAAASDNIDLTFQGFGWMQAGRVMHSTDSINYNFNGNWIQNVACQVTALADIDEHWSGALGIGAGQEHMMQGRAKDARRLSMNTGAYITQASFSYTVGDRQAPRFKLTAGYFPFVYNTNIKNLGLYLMRGPVYPGILMSGFEVPATLPIANTLGWHLHSTLGSFSQDLVFTSETELQPLFDFSLAYLLKYFKPGFLELGAGINFYHILPVTKELTNPRSGSLFTIKEESQVEHPYDRDYLYLDPETGDTTWGTHRGAKVTGFFSLDLKHLFGQGGFGPNDMLIYGEAAVLGLKNYKGIYDKISERIPVMLGFNLPAFGLLDNLSLEVEYYGAKFRNDLKGVQDEFSWIPMGNKQYNMEPVKIAKGTSGDSITVVKWGNAVYPEIPWEDPYDITNMTKDNFKWSLHAARTIQNHFRISAQVANDHFRPSGTGQSPTFWEILTTSRDWYWMLKLLYFF